MNAAPFATGLHAACLARLETGWGVAPGAPGETPEQTLAALWHAACGRPLSAELAVTVALPRLDVAGTLRLQKLVGERLVGAPLAHLTGRQRFMGLEMLASPRAPLVRRETELLARRAFALLARRERGAGAPQVVDACAGAAHVAAALAALVPSARVIASDGSADALAQAHDNLLHLGLAGRVELRRGDALAVLGDPAMPARTDLVTGHVPQAADALAAAAPRVLAPGGWLVIEVVAGTGQALRKRLSACGDWSEVAVDADAAGEIRVLSARRG